jgi:phosphatidylglycerophosphate synthase
LIIVLRDIIVDALRISSYEKKTDVSANIFGKIKTFALVLGIIVVFFLLNKTNSFYIENNSYKYSHLIQYLAQDFFLIIGTICSITSGVIYGIKYYKKLF